MVTATKLIYSKLFIPLWPSRAPPKHSKYQWIVDGNRSSRKGWLGLRSEVHARAASVASARDAGLADLLWSLSEFGTSNLIPINFSIVSLLIEDG